MKSSKFSGFFSFFFDLLVCISKILVLLTKFIRGGGGGGTSNPERAR